MNVYNTIEEVSALNILPLNSLVNADCLEAMKFIETGSVDLILCDLPFNMTKNSWDVLIPFQPLWAEYKRIIKDNGAIVLNSQGLFTAQLIMSNVKMYRYTLVWEKTTKTGFLNAKKMPLKQHEDICVFYKKLPTYNPQKTTGHPRKVSSAHHKRNSKQTTNYNDYTLTSYDSTERFPSSILKFASDKQKSTISPTQKPVALNEYLIKTYSNEGDLVVDNCYGSASTIVACQNLKRNFIGIERDPETFNKGLERVKSNIPLDEEFVAESAA